MTMNRRVKYFVIAQERLAELFTVGEHKSHYDVIEGLPQDAQIVGMFYDFAILGFAVRVWSASFDEVSEGGLIPELNILVRTVN